MNKNSTQIEYIPLTQERKEYFTLHRPDTQLVQSQWVTLPTKYLILVFITNVAVSSAQANDHTQLYHLVVRSTPLFP